MLYKDLTIVRLIIYLIILWVSTPVINAASNMVPNNPTYAGYYVTSNVVTGSSIISSVNGSWIVQVAPNSPSHKNDISSQWVGIGGITAIQATGALKI